MDATKSGSLLVLKSENLALRHEAKVRGRSNAAHVNRPPTIPPAEVSTTDAGARPFILQRAPGPWRCPSPLLRSTFILRTLFLPNNNL